MDEVAANRGELAVRAIPLYAMDISELPDYAHAGSRDLLFVGGFNHPPNVDAVVWFTEQVMPLLSEAYPDTRFHIVGSNPTDAVQELQGDRVPVYGYLSDEELAAIYRKVVAAVVPLRFGAGVKGKVLEAIQMNVPLVTTPTGAEGIPDAEQVMTVVEDAAAFAEAITALFEDGTAITSKMDNYLPWLQRNFSREVARNIVLEDFGPPRRVLPESEVPEAVPASQMGA